MPKVIKRGSAPDPNLPRRPPKPGGRGNKPIVRKDIVEAEREGRRIRAEAEQTATRIVDEAKQQAEELRQTGYDEGYQEGLGRYTEQTTRALMEIEKYQARIEPEYIRLVCACVEKIIGQELALSPEAIIGIVRTTLTDATQQREINVRINPVDGDLLKKNQRRLLDVLARANSIEIREDATISRGGCIVVTELGTIDASLERQLEALRAALDEEVRIGDPDGVGISGGDESYDEYEDDYE